MTPHVEFGRTVWDVIVGALVALSAAIADLMVALFGNSARIIIAGTVASAESLQVGEVTFVLGFVAALLGLYQVHLFLQRPLTGARPPPLPEFWVKVEEEQEDVLPDGGDEEDTEDEGGDD